MSHSLQNSFRKLLKTSRGRLKFYSSKTEEWTPRKGNPNAKDICLPKDPSCTAKQSDCPLYENKPCSITPAIVSKYVSCCMNKNLTKGPCEKSDCKEKKKVGKQTEFKSMWALPEGYKRTCPSLVQRLDDKYYQPSDKDKRRYTQTWISCKSPLKRKRKICAVFKGSEIPSGLETKRSKMDRPYAKVIAAEADAPKLKVNYEVLKLNMENIKKPTKCRTIVMPCCPDISKNLKCHRNREPSNCAKECCPQPCFSECQRQPLFKQTGVECGCTNFNHTCDAYAALHYKNRYKQPPPLPAWPPERPK